MNNSILNSTKKNLGIEADYTDFDPDITMHINSVLNALTQMGIGPSQGYMIEDADDEWSAFLGADAQLNMVKTLVYLRVRTLFDPPTTAHLISAMQAQIAELEWRVSAHRESYAWSPGTNSSNPFEPDEVTPDVVYDGGSP